jgi:hypothetical protein
LAIANFGGKSAYRASQLLVLANQVKTKPKLLIQYKLKLMCFHGEWLDRERIITKARSFYFDPDVKGIVGEQAAFGSEQFNDHQFSLRLQLYMLQRFLLKLIHNYFNRTS